MKLVFCLADEASGNDDPSLIEEGIGGSTGHCHLAWHVGHRGRLIPLPMAADSPVLHGGL